MQYLSLTYNGKELEVPGGVPTLDKNPLSHYVSFAITFFLIFLIATSLIYLLWGGFKWMQSEGDPKNVESARKMITFAIIGLVLGFLSLIIVNTITGIFGITTK